MTHPILITRAHAESIEFESRLVAAGIDASSIHVSPVLEIELTQGFDLPDGDVVATSSNAVRAIQSEIAGRRVFCVGAKTTALAAEFGGDAIQCGDTAQELLAAMRDMDPGQVVYARGEHVALDLSGRLTDAGWHVNEITVYRQRQKPLDKRAKSLLDRETPVVLPLFSARSAAYLLTQLGDAAGHIAVCISDAVAASCRDKGFEEVHVASEPNADAMVMCVVQCEIDLGCRS